MRFAHARRRWTGRRATGRKGPRTSGAGARYTTARWRRDLGMVTAEVATTLPVVALVVAAAVWLVAVAATQLRCADAAREAARAAARGESVEIVQEVARAVAPDDVDVRIAQRGTAVTIEVVASAAFPGAGDRVPSPKVTGRAVAMLEGR